MDDKYAGSQKTHTGLDDKSERFSWFFDDKMKNIQPIFTKIDT